MSIFRKVFQKKREEELGKPANWNDEDEVFVRDKDGLLVKYAVDDGGRLPPLREDKSDAPDDQAQS